MTGGIWPRFDTFGRVAQALGHRIQLADPAARLTDNGGPDAAVVEASWEAAGVLPGAWQIIVISKLHTLLRRAETSKTELALRVGLRKNTVTELWTLLPPSFWVKVKTLAALAQHFGTTLEVMPRSEPWPTPR